MGEVHLSRKRDGDTARLEYPLEQRAYASKRAVDDNDFRSGNSGPKQSQDLGSDQFDLGPLAARLQQTYRGTRVDAAVVRGLEKVALQVVQDGSGLGLVVIRERGQLDDVGRDSLQRLD